MRFIPALLSMSMLAATPLAAAGLAETHQEAAVPPGKIHATAFRPNAPQPCAVQTASDVAGNRPVATRVAQPAEGCADAPREYVER